MFELKELSTVKEILAICFVGYINDVEAGPVNQQLFIDQIDQLLNLKEKTEYNRGKLLWHLKTWEKGVFFDPSYYITAVSKDQADLRGWDQKEYLYIHLHFLVNLHVSFMRNEEIQVPISKNLKEEVQSRIKKSLSEKLAKEVWVAVNAYLIKDGYEKIFGSEIKESNSEIDENELKNVIQAFLVSFQEILKQMEYGDELCFPIGFLKHSMYLVFVKLEGKVELQVHEVGASKEQLTQRVTQTEKHKQTVEKVKPETLGTFLEDDLSVNADLIAYLIAICKAKYQKSSESIRAIYNKGIGRKKFQLPTIDFGSPFFTEQQTIENCVVENYLIRVRYGLHKFEGTEDNSIFEWLIGREKEFATHDYTFVNEKPYLRRELNRYIDQQKKQIEKYRNNPTLKLVPHAVILEKLYSQSKFWFEKQNISQLLHIYISSDCSNSQNYSEGSRYPLNKATQDFLANKEQQILLILGDSGSGKTSLTLKLEEDYWKKFADDKSFDEYTPIRIELKSYTTKTIGVCIKETLKKKYQFSKEEIKQLKKNTSIKLLFIFDGYDEIGGRAELNLYNETELSGWKCEIKSIVTCRSQHFTGEEEFKKYFILSQEQTSTKLNESLRIVYLVPFSENQMMQCLIQHSEDHVKKNEAIRFPLENIQELLKNQAEFKVLLSNPFVLKIFSDIAPKFLNEINTSKIEKNRKINRAAIYQAFLEDWFIRAKARLESSIGKSEVKDKIKDVEKYFFQYARQLAFLYYKTGIAEFKYQEVEVEWSEFGEDELIPEGNKAFEEFFGSEKPETVEARKACPLRRTGESTYSFVHKSFQDYLVGRYLYLALMSGNEKAILENWNTRYLSEDRAVLRFISELIENDEKRKELEERLLQIIKSSSKRADIDKASSNAISVLNWNRYSFARMDLQGIRVPQAYLDEVNFYGANLNKSRFNRSYVRDSEWSEANLEGSELSGLDFGEYPSWEQGSQVLCLVFNKLGTLLATGDEKGILRLWKYSEEECLRKQNLLSSWKAHSKGINSVAFSKDGKYLASGSVDCLVRIWDVESKLEKRALLGHAGSVMSVSWYVDGKRLASGSADNTIRIWNLEIEKEEQVLKNHNNMIMSVDFSVDGKWLASGSSDNTIRIWNAESWIETQVLEGHKDCVTSVNWSFDSKWLVSGSDDRTVRLWDVDQRFKNEHKLEGHTGGVSSVVFSTDGKLLVSGGKEKAIRIWRIDTGVEERALRGHETSVTALDFSPDGKWLMSGSYDHMIRLWRIKSGVEERGWLGHIDRVSSVSFSPDSKCLASGSWDKTIRIWDIERGVEKRQLLGHKGIVQSVSWNHDGKWLASGSSSHDGKQKLAGESLDNTIRIWDVEKGVEKCQLKGHTNYVTSVSWNHDGKYLASGSWDNTIRVWDIESKEKRQVLVGHHTGYVTSVNWSSDGKRLASGSYDKTIRIWDIESKKEKQVLVGHAGYVTSVNWSSDGKCLISGSEDCSVRIWDLGSRVKSRKLTGHDSAVVCVNFNFDGKWLASASEDYTIRIWNVADGKCIKIAKFSHIVRSVSFQLSSDKIEEYLAAGIGSGVYFFYFRKRELDEMPRLTLKWKTQFYLRAQDMNLENAKIDEMNKRLLEQRGAKKIQAIIPKNNCPIVSSVIFVAGLVIFCYLLTINKNNDFESTENDEDPVLDKIKKKLLNKNIQLRIKIKQRAKKESYNTDYEFLDEKIDNFLNQTDKKIFALIGYPGSGKTHFLDCLENKLVNNFKHYQVYPIRVYLKNYYDSDLKKVIEDVLLNNYELNQEQINELKQNKKIVILFDAYDEMKSNSIKNIYDLTDISNFTGALQIITGRADFFEDDHFIRIAFEPKNYNGERQHNKFESYYLDLFNYDDVKEYLKEFYGADGGRHYIEAKDFLDNNQDVMEIVLNPLLLEFYAEYNLSSGAKNSIKELQIPPRIMLFKSFIDNWLTREADKISSACNENEVEIRNILKGSLNKFALSMIEKDSTELSVDDKDIRFTSNNCSFELEDTYIKDRRQRSALLVKLSDTGKLEFYHLSIRDFLVSQMLYEDIKKLSISNWNRFFISQNKQLMLFLYEYLKSSKNLKSHLEFLLNNVRRSRGDESYTIASSNSISMLAKLEYSFFNQDFSNLNLTLANLNNAVFENVDFLNTDLSKAKFKNVLLSNVTFYNTNLTDVDFYEFPGLRLPDSYGSIRSFSCSENCENIVIGTGRGHVMTSDFIKEKLIHSYLNSSKIFWSISAVSFSRDKSFIAYVKNISEREWAVCIGIIHSSEQTLCHSVDEYLSDIEISPNGDFVVSIGKNNLYVLFNSDLINLPNHNLNNSPKVIISNLSERIITYEKNSINIYEYKNKKLSLFENHVLSKYDFQHHRSAAAISTDEKYFAYSNSKKAFIFNIGPNFNIKTNKSIASCETSGVIINMLFFKNNVIISDNNKSIYVWEWRKNHLIGPFDSYSDGVLSLQINEDGKLYVANRDLVRIIDIKNLIVDDINKKSKVTTVRDVSISSDGKILASVDRAGYVTIWQWNEKQKKISDKLSFHGGSRYVELLSSNTVPNRSTVVSSGNHGLVYLAVIDSNNLKRIPTLSPDYPYQKHSHVNGVILTASLFRDDNLVVSASVYDKVMKIFDHNGIDHAIIKCEKDFYNIAASRNNNIIAINFYKESFLIIWRYKQNISVLNAPSSITSVAVSSNGNYIAAGNTAGTIVVWRSVTILNEYKPNVLRGHHWMGVVKLNFDERARFLVSGGNDRSIRIWDIKTETYSETSRRYLSEKIQGLSLSANGKNLIVSSDQHKLWYFEVTDLLKLKLLWRNPGSLDFSEIKLNNSTNISINNQKLIKILNFAPHSSEVFSPYISDKIFSDIDPRSICNFSMSENVVYANGFMMNEAINTIPGAMIFSDNNYKGRIAREFTLGFHVANQIDKIFDDAKSVFDISSFLLISVLIGFSLVALVIFAYVLKKILNSSTVSGYYGMFCVNHTNLIKLSNKQNTSTQESHLALD